MQLLRIYARSNVSQGASGASCMEEIIWGHDLRAYRIPGNNRRLPPDAGRKGVPPRAAPASLLVLAIHFALSRCTPQRRSERVWQFDCKIDQEVVTVRFLTDQCGVIWEPRKKSRLNLSGGKLDAINDGLNRCFSSWPHKLSRGRIYVQSWLICLYKICDCYNKNVAGNNILINYKFIKIDFQLALWGFIRSNFDRLERSFKVYWLSYLKFFSRWWNMFFWRKIDEFNFILRRFCDSRIPFW